MIKLANSDDYDCLYSLIKNSFNKEYADKILNGVFDNERKEVLINIINNNILGFILYRYLFERAEIDLILIDEKYRNNGYGQELLDEAIKKLINNHSVIEIGLEVSVLNHKAINFYRKNGFEINRIRKNYYVSDNSDAIEMVKMVNI